MRHVFGMITQALTMAITYVTILVSILFDSIIFGLPVLLIYNFTFVTKFGAPVLNYIDITGLVLLIKITAVLWKSVNVQESFDNYKEQLNEQENG